MSKHTKGIVHPFNRLRVVHQRKVLWAGIASTVVMLVIMNIFSRPLVTQFAPYGVISYEFAYSPEIAAQVISSWSPMSQKVAAFSLGLDYLFIVVYSGAIGLACVIAGRILANRQWPLAGIGDWLGWGLWGAGILDGIENAALLRILLHGPTVLWSQLAAVCAGVKFALIFLGLVYAIFAAVVGWVIKE